MDRPQAVTLLILAAKDSQSIGPKKLPWHDITRGVHQILAFYFAFPLVARGRCIRVSPDLRQSLVVNQIIPFVVHPTHFPLTHVAPPRS